MEKKLTKIFLLEHGEKVDIRTYELRDGVYQIEYIIKYNDKHYSIVGEGNESLDMKRVWDEKDAPYEIKDPKFLWSILNEGPKMKNTKSQVITDGFETIFVRMPKKVFRIPKHEALKKLGLQEEKVITFTHSFDGGEEYLEIAQCTLMEQKITKNFLLENGELMKIISNDFTDAGLYKIEHIVQYNDKFYSILGEGEDYAYIEKIYDENKPPEEIDFYDAY